MTTVHEEEVRCAQCGVKSRQSCLGSTNSMGSPDLDLRPAEMQRSTMVTWTQFCPTRGLVADDISGELGKEGLPQTLRKIIAFEIKLLGAKDDRCYRVSDALT